VNVEKVDFGRCPPKLVLPLPADELPVGGGAAGGVAASLAPVVLTRNGSLQPVTCLGGLEERGVVQLSYDSIEDLKGDVIHSMA